MPRKKDKQKNNLVLEKNKIWQLIIIIFKIFLKNKKSFKKSKFDVL